MVGSRRTIMVRYFMIAMVCVVVKTGVRIVHYANPTDFSQASIP